MLNLSQLDSSWQHIIREEKNKLMPIRSHIPNKKPADSSETRISRCKQATTNSEANGSSPSFIIQKISTIKEATLQPLCRIYSFSRDHPINCIIIIITIATAFAILELLVQQLSDILKYGILTGALALISFIALSVTLSPSFDKEHVLAALPHYLYVLFNITFLETMVSNSMADKDILNELVKTAKEDDFIIGAIYLSLCLTLFIETWINLCYALDDKHHRHTSWYKYSTVFAVFGILSFVYYVPVLVIIDKGVNSPLISVISAICIALIGLLTFTYADKCLSRRIEGESKSRP